MPQAKVTLELSEEMFRRLESEATKLHLSVPAYILYLHERTKYGRDVVRFDQMIHEVFGKHGESMRRLAKH